jgi:hypothetical protein
MRSTRWEYMVMDVGVAGFFFGPDLDGDALNAKLNELGDEGWEAVGMTSMEMGQGQTRSLVLILKRPRE